MTMIAEAAAPRATSPAEPCGVAGRPTPAGCRLLVLAAEIGELCSLVDATRAAHAPGWQSAEADGLRRLAFVAHELAVVLSARGEATELNLLSWRDLNQWGQRVACLAPSFVDSLCLIPVEGAVARTRATVVSVALRRAVVHLRAVVALGPVTSLSARVGAGG